MKTMFLSIAAVAAAVIAAPAFAQDFSGPRAGVVVGVSGDESPFDNAEFVYGAQVGYDVAVSPGFRLGAEADIAKADIEDVDVTQTSVGVRMTFPASTKGALFVSGGYSNLDAEYAGFGENFGGYRLGGGGEVKLGRNAYTSLEYRYSEYDLSDYGASAHTHSALLGLGLRF